MSNKPPPSTLIFLSELPNIKVGAKVRFLGCVQHYDPKIATLTLQHNYPASTQNPTVQINIDQVLDTIKHTDLEVGAWLNVICNVSTTEQSPLVQATILWNAGPGLKVEEYEKALEKRKGASSGV